MKLSLVATVLLLSLLTITSFSQSSGSELQIPSWIKNNAKWWADGKIGDSDFVQGIQYLIKQKIMQVPQTQSKESGSQQIPLWVKSNAGWWADGKISDNDFVAGIQYLIQINIIKIQVEQNMKLSSASFENEKFIPFEYTCDGEDLSPPLTIVNVPKNAKSLALIMDDPDAPVGTFTHWVVWNISPQKSQFTKGEQVQFPQGSTDFGSIGYGGPCPPSGTHRYFFKLYALDSMLDLKDGTTKKDLEKAMTSHIIEQATLIGKYSRS